MNTEEIIRTLTRIKDSINFEVTDSQKKVDALNEAIQKFKQESCEDAISRDAVLEKAVYTETEDGWCGYTVDVDYIKSLPSVNPHKNIVNNGTMNITL